MERTRIRPLSLLLPGLLLAGAGSAQPVCSINLGADQTICQGGSAPLSLPIGYTNYLWSTGATTQNTSVSAAGNYWGQVSYNSGNLVANGNFSAGNTGFSSQWSYNTNLVGEGTYFVDNVSTPHHASFSGTGNGLFMMVNAGWGAYSMGLYDVWCQNITVCPGQTYTLSYRARTLSNSTPARLQWFVDGVAAGAEVLLPAFNAGWQTINLSWTSGAAQVSANCCLRVTSGDGVGNDFGLDDISISGTIVLRDYVQVNVTPLPAVNLGPDLTLCAGTPHLLNAAVPGGSYLWQDGATTSSYNVSTAGNYSVTVTANGCSNSDAVMINYNPYPVVDLGPGVTLCDGEQLLLNAAQPGGTYLWQNNSTAATFNVVSAGTYDVDVTVGGCTTNDAITVNYTPLPVVDLGSDLTICQGDQAVLGTNLPAGSYVWQDGSTNATFIATSAGSYDVDVTVNGCSASDAVNVTVNPNPTVDIGDDATLCTGDQLVLNATTPGATYLWQDGSTAATFNATGTGTYDVDVTVNGCTANDVIDLTFAPVPTVELGPAITICEGDPLQLNAFNAGASYLWQDGSTSSTFDVISSGIYDVTVTLGTCSASDAVNVTVNPNPSVDIGDDATLCIGDQLVLTATTPGATYLWQDGSTAATFNATGTGTYDVAVTVNGCTTNDAIDLTFAPVPTVELGPAITICEGDPLQLNAFNAGASYLWQDGSTTSTFDVTSSGTYDVTVTLGTCSASDAVNVTVNPNPTVDIGDDATLCIGDQLVLNATTPGATYLWQDGSTAATFNATGTGTYDVAVTVNGCTTNDAIDLTFAPVPTVELGPAITICDGDPLQLNAFNAGASYLWQDGSTSSTFDVTSSGTYDVTVSLGTCSVGDAVNVTVNPNPSVDIGDDATLCIGDQLVLNATTPGASYLWQDGSTGATFNATGTGTYDVAVTVNGCTTNDAIDLTFAPVPTVELGPAITICEGDPLQLNAFNAGASYLWQDGSTSSTFDVTSSGTYDVTVSLGTCSVSDAVNVTVNPNPTVDIGDDATLCIGDQLVLNATTPGATYLWQDGSTAATFNATGTGTYDVAVTVNGCTTNDAIDLTFAPVPTVELGPAITICEGDPLQLNAFNAGASYLWQDGSTSSTFDVTSSGTYDVTVSLGTCSVSDAVNVTVNPMPEVELGDDLSVCPGVAVTFDASAPNATYLWQDNSTASSFTTDQPGSYSVTVTANGCSTSDQVTLSNIDLESVDLGDDITICDGVTLTLDATLPGSTYLWNTGAATASIDVSTAGSFAVEVFQSGCSVSDDIQVAVLPSPVVDLGNDTTLCDQATLTLDAFNPGATYVWSTGSTSSSINVAAPGTYTVTAYLNGCTRSDAIEVAYLGALSLSLGNDTTLCPGAALDLHASLPGGTTVWSTNVVATDITVHEPDIYWATITVSGCAVSDSITVGEVPLPDLDLGTDAAICTGNSVSFDITVPGASYLWDDGSTEPDRLIDEAGEYWARITLSGCITTDTFNLALIPLPVVDLGPDTAICAGSTLVLDATTPGASYLWTNNSTAATFTAIPGDAGVQVTVNGCTSADAIHIDALPVPEFALPADTTLCNGSVWIVDAAQAGASYLWQDGSTSSSFMVDQPGTYSATVNIGPCAVQDLVQVTYFDESLVDLGPDTTLCPGEQVMLNLALPGVFLTWPDGSHGTSYLVDNAGAYSVVANANGCETSDQITVSYVPLPEADLGPDRTLCEGDSLYLVVPPTEASVLWHTGTGNDSLLTTSTSMVQVTLSLDGCTSTDAVSVTFLPVVEQVDLGPDAPICLGDEIQLDATVNLATYVWNTGEHGPGIMVTAPGTYHVQISGPCINAADTIEITEGDCAPLIHVPNSFTPNGDGFNEVFTPVVTGNLRAYTFRIFDRWGENIFSSEQPGEGWDGSVNGTLVQDAVYVWTLRYKAVNDEGIQQEFLTGTVTLLR